MILGGKMRISDEILNILIEGLQEYKKEGVNDPWILEGGIRIEPLDVLIELRELRKKIRRENEK